MMSVKTLSTVSAAAFEARGGDFVFLRMIGRGKVQTGSGCHFEGKYQWVNK